MTLNNEYTKNLTKTISWMLCSIVIIGVSAFIFGATVYEAIITGIVASISKTPFFSLHEFVFEKLWKGYISNK